MRLPTVRVKNPHEPGGYTVINESDFGPEIHQPWEEEPDPKTKRKSKAKASDAKASDDEE